jgi:hypothetical protein
MPRMHPNNKTKPHSSPPPTRRLSGTASSRSDGQERQTLPNSVNGLGDRAAGQDKVKLCKRERSTVSRGIEAGTTLKL